MPQDVLRDLPGEDSDRKAAPIFTGVIEYFPLALMEVARVSKAGNDQHNPGQPLHWAREKSRAHLDCAQRHLIEHDRIDTDGQYHLAKAIWRLCAQLQTMKEREAGFTPKAILNEQAPKSLI